MASGLDGLPVQDNDAGVHVQDLHTVGKLHERLFPVSKGPNDQRRPQAFDGLFE